ncbi:DUF1630-domain-containing protein [Punctularia strigosozonata HHB-11173 SS5]|uniref:DUF1630-domain-containing protein n=1 Tax=Punctularia strigosozonata (strain HHB-11173) TaxID=741275 RepID=R7S1D3_PUNST|nr:DUF1630-domain-containing protein [Punctularia strigosozonata HHB-11173 SS5]EIN04033.1 DUF1630-domain-containing protein [Punctularia strigosozonata HHB-11173 SS5]
MTRKSGHPEEVDIGSLTISRAGQQHVVESSSSSDVEQAIRQENISAGDIGIPHQPSRIRPKAKTMPDVTTNQPYAAPSILGFAMEPEKVQKMQRWIIGLVVVNFDLDLGPVIHSIYPDLAFSKETNQNIAFSSFPDSLQFAEGVMDHSFRIRDSGTRSGPADIDGFIYGFSHFTQHRDSSSKRGYLQRSFVLLTQHAYPALFSHISAKLGSLHNSHGEAMLEAACHNIASWSDPTAGSTVELGFLGSVLRVQLPQDLDEPQLSQIASDMGEHYIPASLAPASPAILAQLDAALSHLWSIWECLVLCEPLLIYAPSPSMTSQVVWWLRDLLRPIPSATDFRPYFTIHDDEYPALVNPRIRPKSGLLLGVTNPFVSTECSHWPHVLSLGRESSGRADGAGHVAGPAPGWTTKTHKRYISKDRALLKRMENARGHAVAEAELSHLIRRHFSSRTTSLLAPLNRYLNTLLPSAPSSLAVTSITPSPSPSPSLTSLSSLSAPGPSPSLMSLPNSSTLSASHPPPHSSSSSHSSRQVPPDSFKKPTARLKPFSQTAFLASLKAGGAALPFKSAAKQKEFYQRWLKTPAFGMWLARQEEVVGRVFGG